MGYLDTAVQEKIDKDAEFQASIKDLPDNEKSEKVQKKRDELIEAELSDRETKFTDQQTRAEKAETELKKLKKPKGGEGENTGKDEDTLSTTDVLTISRSSVHEDDIEFLTAQRKATGKSIAELLKNDDVKVVLNARAEKRKTANALNIGPARPGSQKPDGATLNRELTNEGKVPEPGSDDAEELFWQRRGGKRS